MPPNTRSKAPRKALPPVETLVTPAEQTLMEEESTVDIIKALLAKNNSLVANLNAMEKENQRLREAVNRMVDTHNKNLVEMKALKDENKRIKSDRKM